MMMMSEAAKALGGELIGADTRFTAVSKDTRSIAAGDLYIAIKGDRFDGHAFIRQAGKAGAAGALAQPRGQGLHLLQGHRYLKGHDVIHQSEMKHNHLQILR